MKDTDVQRYDNSVSYETGWFRKEILLAAEVSQGNTKFDTTPCGVLRYNPVTDSGKRK